MNSSINKGKENYPMDFKEIEDEKFNELRKYYKGSLAASKHVYIGPKHYLYPNTGNIEFEMKSLYKMEIRSSDIFIVTFPRSGTTMTQELVWLIANNLDYSTAKSKHLIQRYCTLGSYFINVDIEKQKLEHYRRCNLKYLDILTRMVTPATELMASETGQRSIKCHIPLSLLPPNTIDTAKVIYLVRDPRDVAVSLYHLFKLMKVNQFEGDFKTFWRLFTEGLVIRGPYVEHVKEACEKWHHPNMLLLFYENLIGDLRKEIQRICKFLDRKYTEDEINGLCEHMNFKKFKENQAVNLDFLKEFDAFVPNDQSFIRQGTVGGWRDLFDEEMTEQANDWIMKNFSDTDLEFIK